MYDVYGIMLRVHWSKTIQFWEHTVIVSLIRFLVKPLYPVSVILQAFSLAPSAVLSSQGLCFQAGIFQTCFIYRSFMVMRRVTLLLIGFSPKNMAHTLVEGELSLP